MRFRRRIWSVVVVTSCVCWPTIAQDGSDHTEFELVTVRDDLYVISPTDPTALAGNITVLLTEEGVLLVDDAEPEDYDNVRAMVSELTAQPVRYVINTHYHGDHSGGNPMMRSAGAEIIASELARGRMAESRRPGPIFSDGLGLPTITFNDYLRVYVGGIPVDLYHFGPAHTDGDVVVHFPEQQVVVVGDLFANRDAGVTQGIAYSGGGNAAGYAMALDGTLALSFDVVITGHGDLADRIRLEEYKSYTFRLRDSVREMLREGRSSDEIESVLRSDFGWQDFHVDISLEGLLLELQ